MVQYNFHAFQALHRFYRVGASWSAKEEKDYINVRLGLISLG